MNNPEILEQLKRLNLLIENALNEAGKGQNISFFKTLIQQNAVDIYQNASMLEGTVNPEPAEKKISRQEFLVNLEEPDVTEPIKQVVEAEPVKNVHSTEISEKKPVETIPAQAFQHKVKITRDQVPDDQELSLNERLSKNKQPVMNFADKSNLTPITDLVKFIPIGKKFEFINGLFDGNADVYKSSLHTVQHASSYEQATEYLESNIIGPYDWNANEKLAAEFFGLIKRRFIK